jgi:hypothetical protein
MNEINTVQLIIRKFLFAIKDLRKEDSAAGRWLDWLGETLQYQDLMENMEPFGAEMLAEAKAFSMKKRLGGQLKAAKGSLIKEGNNTPTAEEIEERRIEMYGEEAVEITAAATTSDGVVKADGRQATKAESATADTDSGEGGTPGIERTSSPLPSPTPVKTDPKPTKKAKAEGKPEEQKYPHGEFENIMLSTREYAKLCERLDNADSLIEEADAYLEAQPDKKKKYKNHYAMLLNWDRRRKEFEGVKPRFKTAVDRDQEEIRKLAEYYAEQESDERRDNPKMKLLGGA